MTRKITPQELREKHSFVTELVDTGQYYKDVRDWYAQIYLHPVTQRSVMLLVAAVILVAFFPAVFAIQNLFPLEEHAPFPIYSEWDTEEYYPELKKLAANLDNAEEMLLRYFIGNYVRDREEYTPSSASDWKTANEKRWARVEHTSGRRVFREYEGLMDANNIQSPTQRYAHHTARAVEVQTVRFPPGKGAHTNAVVDFKVILKNVENPNAPDTIEYWQANMGFSFTDVQLVIQEKKPLQLFVTSYNVQKRK